jgi:mannobiose 2-epimerase
MRSKLICCGLIFITSFTLNAQFSKDTLWLSVHKDMEKLLFENMLPVWYPKVLDIVNGGYFSDFTYDWKPEGSQQKMIVTQARHVWSCAQLKMFTKEDVYATYAKHGYVFLKDVMWDRVHGGFYNLVERNGIPVKEKDAGIILKNAYGNAFGLYALATLYEATKEEEVLAFAKKVFLWLENNSYDPVYGGYYQFLTEEGKAIKTGWGGVPPKDQNSSIHLMEAFTQLYAVWPDPLVKKRLSEMIYLIRDKMTHEKGYLQLFFANDFTPFSLRDSLLEVQQKGWHLDHVSFGHDIETAYLLMDASEKLMDKEPNDITLKKEHQKTMELGKKMVDHGLKWGWDKTSAGVYDAGYYYKLNDSLSIIKDTKNWWAQSETLNTLWYFQQLYPNDSMNYKHLFVEQWDFIKKYLIDWENGDWYASSLDKDPQAKFGRKSNIWKGNYHTIRTLLNVKHGIKTTP